MQKRKSKILDGVDKDILRVLYEKKSLPGRQIARKVGLTASAVAARLDNLRCLGYLRKSEGVMRCFQRRDSKVKSPICINWELDLK
jgi:DNA-binding Lrp family transcriptional regulator